MSEHQAYEILCAWVASGRGSADDLKELTQHLRLCSDCRERLSDFAQLSAQALPLHGEARHRGRVPSGMTARFIARARLQGLPLQISRPFSLRNHAWPGLAWAAAAAVVVLAAVLAIRDVQGTLTARPGAQQATVPVLSNVTAHAELKETGPGADPEDFSQLHAEVSSSRLEIAALESKINGLQQDLMASDSVKAALSARLAGLENDNAGLHTLASTKDSRVVDLEAQLKQKDATSMAQIADLAQQMTDLEKLKTQLSQRESKLDQDRHLLASSTQARDLIVARNLHIIDVHDNDRSGRMRPFGRIFYTEGQSLVFYAYDLDAASGRDTKVSFHVWGGNLAGQLQAKNLGIFHSEDVAAGRWVLTCDDPHVLAEINTVFVTMESGKDDFDHPKGRRILYAFLGDPANHP